ncbi:MAG: L-threonylcarbamoyladenylate synthase [Candidatus Pacearchaeota archaeon]
MKIIKINEIDEEEILIGIEEGKIFIYPTDTIYGLGCDAENKDSVEKIKQIKQRDRDKPLSIIAPYIKWIEENLIIDTDLNKYLPGPYTIILKKKNLDFLKHVSNTDSIGIRIPYNEFTKIIQNSGKPFITTSVNLSGESAIESINEIPKEIEDKIDIIIDAGKLEGRPSTLIIGGKEIKR